MQQVAAPAVAAWFLAPPATAVEHQNESGVSAGMSETALLARTLGDWMSGRNSHRMSPFMSNARGHQAIVAGSNGCRDDGHRARLPFGIEDDSRGPPVR